MKFDFKRFFWSINQNILGRNKRFYIILTLTKKKRNNNPGCVRLLSSITGLLTPLKARLLPPRQRQFFAQALRARQVLLMSDWGRQNQDLSCNCQGRPCGSYYTKYQGETVCSPLLCVNLSATTLLERVQPPCDWTAQIFRKELRLSVQLSMFALRNSRPRALNHVSRNYHL